MRIATLTSLFIKWMCARRKIVQIFLAPRFLYIMASNSQVDFGENYVQELLDKAAELPNSIRSDDVGWGPHLDLHIRTHHRADRVHDSVFDSQPGFEPE